TDAAGKYRGMTITDARKAVINDLNEAGLLVKQEDLKQNVGTCWRCHTPIEYIATKEWFLKMLPFKEKVLTASSSLRWFPEYMQKRLIDWVNSLSWDWCISRRRYLATPVPVWECEECGDIIVAKPEQCYVEPLKAKPPRKCRCGKMPKGTELVFDTWMDSSLTPLYNCGWQRDPKLFKKLWPMTLRPQAHDIIRTWAYYTILRSVLLTDSAPFRDIMISGYIMGPDGKPMHASRGNVVNPLDVLAKYNADTFRYFASLCDLGVDTPFRWADVEHGARLLTKLWNVGRFVSAKITKPGKRPVLASADAWLLSKLQSLVHESTAALDNYNFTKAMRDLEAFFWTTFCDNYLEIVKQRFYVDDASAKWTLYYSFLTIIKLFAPFLPHITEELYQKLFKAYENYESIHLSEWPKPEKTLIDKKAEAAGDAAVAIISAVRTWKHDQKMPLNAPLKQLIVEADDKMQNALRPFLTDIAATTKAEKIEFGVGKIEAGAGLKFTAII
ncbi:MAG: class I tRNA ligase family protein, partial [Candidatus Aenigmatarchaeota archaeon]